VEPVAWFVTQKDKKVKGMVAKLTFVNDQPFVSLNLQMHNGLHKKMPPEGGIFLAKNRN